MARNASIEGNAIFCRHLWLRQEMNLSGSTIRCAFAEIVAIPVAAYAVTGVQNCMCKLFSRCVHAWTLQSRLMNHDNVIDKWSAVMMSVSCIMSFIISSCCAQHCMQSAN